MKAPFKSVKLLLLLILFIVSVHVFSQQPQQIYRTIKGDFTISIKYNDSSLIAISNQLIVTLDYETSKIAFRVKYETLHTGVDIIDTKLKALKDEELIFIGKLNVFINTKEHPPQKFDFSGLMNRAKSNVATEGNGMLVHLASGGDATTPSCRLALTLKSTLSELNLTEIFTDADDAVQIDIRQSLLEREKSN